MSSFPPSVSPLYPTEGIGQGVVGDISQRQGISHTTSIHILDDESLLNIFYLYRPVVKVTEDENFDELRISIVTGRRWDRVNWWHKPAHVCRRWRNLILGSASFLGLDLVCTLGTPVADMLANSPTLPLVIDYLGGGRDVTAEDEEGIFIALEQPNPIRCIRVGLSLHGMQKFVMAIDHELPILEYLTIQAPHLHHLGLVGVAPPIRSRLLTTAVGLVTLRIFMDDSFTYLNPNTLLQWISPLSQLETLEIITFPNLDVETQLSHTPTITYATFPNLRLLSFLGASAYLEELIRQIATPRLERLRLMFFEELAFSIPCLVRFMNTTENKMLMIDSANVDRWNLDWHISSMAQIVDALGQVFSGVEHLILDHVKDGRSSEEVFDFEVDRTEWHKLLRPFSNVKNLRVNHGLVEEFSRYLGLDDGELPPELLPELQELTYSGSSNPGDAFTPFIDARQNAGRPVSFKLVHRSPKPKSLRP
ncbi:hypothetical protein BGY98DRAFT_1100250 [Russula aff. rugulosa BPL654]|nr:hypothetical protein BGY98DRAFT_1100250 [Russula aff. rugulosa BPL654]